MSLNNNASQSSQDLTVLGIPMAEAQASYFRRTGETVRIRLPRAKRAPEIRVSSGNPIVPFLPESAVRSGAPEEDPDVQFLMEVRRNGNSGNNRITSSPPVKERRMDLSKEGMDSVEGARGGQMVSHLSASSLPSGVHSVTSGIPEKDKENRNLPVAPKIKGFRINDILGLSDFPDPDEQREFNRFLAQGMPPVKKRRWQFSRGQMIILEAAFAKNPRWSPEERGVIAQRCEEVVDPRGTKEATAGNVKVWLQNKKFKMRLAARKELQEHEPLRQELPPNKENLNPL